MKRLISKYLLSTLNKLRKDDTKSWGYFHMKQSILVKHIYHQVIHEMLVVINRFIVNMFSFLTFPPMQTYQPFFSWGKRKMKILCISIVKKSIHSGWTESWEYILTVLLFVIHKFFSIGWLFSIYFHMWTRKSMRKVLEGVIVSCFILFAEYGQYPLF